MDIFTKAKKIKVENSTVDFFEDEMLTISILA